MTQASIRLAVRAVILSGDRLLLVNAWKGRTHLWCAPGGGVERHRSLPENLRREVREETGLEIAVGEVCLVNEFHDPGGSFHQVDIYFRATPVGGDALREDWRDPEGIVSARRWVSAEEYRRLAVKPDSLFDVAFRNGAASPITYDPLEPILR